MSGGDHGPPSRFRLRLPPGGVFRSRFCRGVIAVVAALVSLMALSGCVALRFVETMARQQSAGGVAFDASGLPAVARKYESLLLKAGATCPEIGPEVVAAVIHLETGKTWNPKIVNKQGVNFGLGQFNEDSWKDFGKDGDGDKKADYFNAADSIISTGGYLCYINKRIRELSKDGRYGIPKGSSDQHILDLTMIGYNRGPNIWQNITEGKTDGTIDARGYPSGGDGNGTTADQYVQTANKYIASFTGPVGGGPVGPLREAIVKIALTEAELGLSEAKSGMKCVPKYWYPKGLCAAWCAMFASWVWTEAGVKKGNKEPFRTASVQEFHTVWGASHKGSVTKDIRQVKKGDVVLFIRPRDYWGHVGVITRVSDDKKTFDYVDGNGAGDNVALKKNYPASASDIIEYVSPMAD